MRFTNVIHTKDRVIVVGMRDMSNMVLFSHDKHNPLQYTNKYFNTMHLYNRFLDPQFNIAPLRKDGNFFIVAASVVDGYTNSSRMEFTIFNVDSSIIKQQTQVLINPTEGCDSKIIDMKFQDSNMSLYVLACNGCGQWQGGVDMIFRLRPFISVPYQAFAIIPQEAMQGFNLMRSLTLYNGGIDYLLFGTMATIDVSPNSDGSEWNGDLYFFDRNSYTFDSSYCGNNCSLDVDIREAFFGRILL